MGYTSRRARARGDVHDTLEPSVFPVQAYVIITGFDGSPAGEIFHHRLAGWEGRAVEHVKRLVERRGEGIVLAVATVKDRSE